MRFTTLLLFTLLTCSHSLASPVQDGFFNLEMTTNSLFARQQQNQTSSSNNTNTTCSTNNGVDPSSIQPALYTENYRPQIHFSPSTGFMNDPNGLVRSGDTWHMYFQYNPNATVAGDQHWGYATSKDLYTWQNHLPAIAPENAQEGIYTGSAVLDLNNTSGFFNDSTLPENRFVAIYTLNTPTSETQNIAYSTDGQNYTKYSGNPIISVNSTQFRDPKVVWDSVQQQWLMAVAHSQAYEVGFYTSTNLREWKEVSRFGPFGILGYQYECPNFVQVPVQGGEKDGELAWVLVLSINPGAPIGGSFEQAFIGDWNGTSFVPWNASAQILDFGKDFYASQFYYNPPEGKAINVGWVGNWQYAQSVPTSPWRSEMTVPRETYVRWIEMNPLYEGYQVTMQPYGLENITQTNLLDSVKTNQTIDLIGDGAFEILANFSYPSTNYSANPKGEIQIFTPNQGENLTIGVLFGQPGTLYVDRRFAGQQWSNTNPFFTDRFSTQFQQYSSENGTQTIQIQMIVDRTVTEVFGQNGTASAVVLTFWDNDQKPNALTIGLGDDLIKLDSLKVNAINSTWPTCP